MIAFFYVLLFCEDVAAPKASGFDKFSNKHVLMKKKVYFHSTNLVTRDPQQVLGTSCSALRNYSFRIICLLSLILLLQPCFL